MDAFVVVASIVDNSPHNCRHTNKNNNNNINSGRAIITTTTRKHKREQRISRTVMDQKLNNIMYVYTFVLRWHLAANDNSALIGL